MVQLNASLRQLQVWFGQNVRLERLDQASQEKLVPQASILEAQTSVMDLQRFLSQFSSIVSALHPLKDLPFGSSM